MATLGDMKTRIARELRRDDLTTDIAAAITTAISEYQKERFRFSDIDATTPPTFATVNGQTVYGFAASPFISQSFYVDYLLVEIGGTLEEIDRRTPIDIRLLNQTNGSQMGQPQAWAYEGNSILLYPTPNQAYTLTIGAHRLVPEPANDVEAGNVWMNEAELLIRSRAKYEIATHRTLNAELALAMSPNEPAPGVTTGHATYWAYKSLKGASNRMVGRGRVKPMWF